MSRIGHQRFLLSRFTEFYEEVARIKLAVRDGRLPTYLAGGGVALSGDAAGLASGVAGRLADRLRRQGQEVRECGTAAEIEAYRSAQYVMAALADEIFILELDWPGRGFWGGELLEQRLYRRTTAGRDVFALIDRVLAGRNRTPLAEDLASVCLMALQLGFRGQYRGRRGQPVLDGYRAKLLRFTGGSGDLEGSGPAFAQAYRHHISEANEQRLAPVGRWYLYGAMGLALYLLISSALWLWAIRPFTHLGGGS